jgi:hypothetical protein
VVTALTDGSTSEFLAGELGSEAAGDAAAGAIAGVAGSLAGQTTAVAEGLQSGINWGGVLESGLADAVTFGVGGELSSGGIAAAGDGGTIFANGAGALTVAGDAVVGAASYVGTSLAGQLTGQPEHFSWAGLVGSAVGAAVGGEVASYIPANSFFSPYLGQITQYAVGDVVNREVSVALGDQHQPSWAQVGENILAYAIGTPLGEAAAQPIASALREYQAQQNESQAIQNYINHNGGSVFAAFPYQGGAGNVSDDSGAMAATPITGNNGAPGFQYSDGVQTFAVQDGVSNSEGGNNLPGPFSPPPSYYVVQNGETLSGILGTSNPAMVGMESRLNGLSGSSIYPGESLILGTSSDIQGGDAASGQDILNQDNATIAAQNLRQVSGGVLYSGPDLDANPVSNVLSGLGAVANGLASFIQQHPILTLAAQSLLFGGGASTSDPSMATAMTQDYPAPSVPDEPAPSLLQANSDIVNNEIPVIGALAGEGVAAYNFVTGAFKTMMDQDANNENLVFGKPGLNLTNVFEQGASDYNTSINNTTTFFENHPVSTAENAANNWWNQTAAMSISDDPAERFQASMNIGEGVTYVATAADGAYGVLRTGASATWSGFTRLTDAGYTPPPLISAANAATDSEAGYSSWTYVDNDSNTTVTTATPAPTPAPSPVLTQSGEVALLSSSAGNVNSSVSDIGAQVGGDLAIAANSSNVDVSSIANITSDTPVEVDSIVNGINATDVAGIEGSGNGLVAVTPNVSPASVLSPLSGLENDVAAIYGNGASEIEPPVLGMNTPPGLNDEGLLAPQDSELINQNEFKYDQDQFNGEAQQQRAIVVGQAEPVIVNSNFEPVSIKAANPEPSLSPPETAATAVSSATGPQVVEGAGNSLYIQGHKIYDPAFSPLSTNPGAQYRFSDPTYRSTGGDVYFGENLATSYYEVRQNVAGKSLFVGDVHVDNILDLTDENVLDQMNIDSSRLQARVDSPIDQKTVYGYTNQIANQAFDAGYNGILYPSTRGPGNAVVLFGGRYNPNLIAPIVDFPLQ